MRGGIKEGREGDEKEEVRQEMVRREKKEGEKEGRTTAQRQGVSRGALEGGSHTKP